MVFFASKRNFRMSKENFTVKRIHKQSEYAEWLLKKHYAHRIPSISYAFGLYENNALKGVCTFGVPPSRGLCNGICGESYFGNILELNRLCVESEEVNITSWFVANCLNTFDNKIIVSYADTEQGHIGKIYQATNFMYSGLSAKRTEWMLRDSGMHNKTIAEKYTLDEMKNDGRFYMQNRPRKHRYIYICGNKTFKKEALKALNYPICDYPKGETQRYDASYKPVSQMIMF